MELQIKIFKVKFKKFNLISAGNNNNLSTQIIKNNNSSNNLSFENIENKKIFLKFLSKVIFFY